MSEELKKSTYKKSYYEANKESFKTSQKKYYEANKEIIRQRRREAIAKRRAESGNIPQRVRRSKVAANLSQQINEHYDKSEVSTS